VRAITASGEAIDGTVRIDGLSIEVVVTEEPAPEGLSAITMEDGAWPTVSANTILVDRGPVSSLGGTSGIEALYGHVWVEMRDNTITVLDPNGIGGNGSTAVHLDTGHGESTLVFERNRIFVTDPSGSSGLGIVNFGEVCIRNNLIVVHSADEAVSALHLVRSSGTVANNTCYVDGGNGLGYRAIFAQGAGETPQLDVLSNIFGSRSLMGTAVQQEPSYEIFYDYNLAFRFSSEYTGTVTGGPNNQYTTDDIFEAVFSSAYDTDPSDGDQSDYRLLDAGDLYAVDAGMDLGDATPCPVTDDIDGEERPKGSGYDRGADEAR
jgi:hypothetical protein